MEKLPYCGPAPAPSELLLAWNFDVVLIGALVLLSSVGGIYLRLADRKRQQTFAVAIGAAILAFVSPLCATTVALFSARTLHHLIVLGILAPALALALPLRRVPVAGGFFGMSLALWLWHVPHLYSMAWDHASIYWAMQFALILPAWAFWSGVLNQRELAHVVWLLPLVGQMGLLGALLTFAGQPFYLEHLAHAERYGLTALQDQQLAGLVMWVPGMAPVAALAALMAWRLLRQEGRA